MSDVIIGGPLGRLADHDVTLNLFQGLYSKKDAEINSAGRPFVQSFIKQQVTKTSIVASRRP